MIRNALATDFKPLPPLEVVDAESSEPEDESNVREPFPVDALPYPYREMALAVSESVMVPVVLSAVSALSVVSAAIGKQLQVRSKPNRTTPGLLYAILFAEQATGKSEAARHMMKPMTDIHLALEDKWQKHDHPAIQAELDDIEDAIKRIKREQNDDPGNLAIKEAKLNLFKRRTELEGKTMPAICIDDLTIEAFAVGLKENGEQLTLFSADAAKTIQNLLGRYNPNGEPDDALHRKSFSMDFHTERRLSRGPVTLEAPAATLLWFCQPYLIPKIFNNDVLRHGGFISRCLAVDTKTEITDEPEEDVAIPGEIQDAYSQQVKALFEAFRLKKGEPTIINRDAVVKSIMRENYNQIAARRRSGDLKDINEFAARWNELAWRIAVVLHAMRFGDRAGQYSLEEVTIRAAIKIQQWFQKEELRLLAAGRDQAAIDKAERLIEAVCRKSVSQNGDWPKVTLRDLERIGWEKEAIIQIIESSNGKLTLEMPPRTGRGRPSAFVLFKGEHRPPHRGNLTPKGH